MPVNTPRADYAAKLPQWQRCRTVAEGSDAVKAAGETYLPALDSHKDPAKGKARYDAYVMRASFFNATSRTVEGLAGAIFQKPPVAKVKRVEADLADVTLTNVSLEMMALSTTQEILKVGRAGILVDMDVNNPTRPYWIRYLAEDIIAWRTARQGGDQVLTMVVLREIKEAPDPEDPFVTTLAEQYRVLELLPTGYQQTIYTKPDAKKDEWKAGPPVISTRRQVPLDFIPFVFIGPTTVEPTPEKPPLLDLVDMNLSHYRTNADLEHGLHYTALPTPWVSGAVNGGTEGEPLTIGSGTAWNLEKEGRAGMLEFTGQGLGALEKADDRKRKLMATLGAKLLESQGNVQEAAQTVAMRHAGENASLRTIAGAVEQALSLCLNFHSWWMGTEAKPIDVKATVELNKEFLSVDASPDKVRAALMAVQEGELSSKEFWGVLQRGGWVNPNTSFEVEQAQRNSEQPPPAEGGPDPDADPDIDPNDADAKKPPVEKVDPDDEGDEE